MAFVKKAYRQLWQAIIRPERDSYTLDDLGPPNFNLGTTPITRSDFSLTNPRGLTLECSHFEPRVRVAEQLPCVIYLHGNCSSRLEALRILPDLLCNNITVFCFDMSGSGLSQGQFISLGWYERDDLGCVIEYLRSTGKVSCIGLWGRSMGAATALLHGDRDPSIAGMVIDSPFSNLKQLCHELAKSYSRVPGFIRRIALGMVRKTIKKKAGFDVKALNPVDSVHKCYIPALFIAASGDDFIRPVHTETLFAQYAGDKNKIIVAGDHNSVRPQFMLDSVGIFFYNTLQCQLLPTDVKMRHKHCESRGMMVWKDENAYGFVNEAKC